MTLSAPPAGQSPALAPFHPLVRDWFTRAFAEPTRAQREGWPPIARGDHTLILAPTGSGKTLAAFLWALNGIVADKLAGREPARLLYLSPLKALNYDVERNLRGPLAGMMLGNVPTVLFGAAATRFVPLRFVRIAAAAAFAAAGAWIVFNAMR